MAEHFCVAFVRKNTHATGISKIFKAVTVSPARNRTADMTVQRSKEESKNYVELQ